MLFILAIPIILTIIGISPVMLGHVVATSIICPGAASHGTYTLCSESHDLSSKTGKSSQHLMASRENDILDSSGSNDLSYSHIGNNIMAPKKTEPIYCSSDLDLAIVDTSIGGDVADLVCETRLQK
jgi:hypothetical protein